jgi:A/G-specific adenine glycosylase
VTTNEAIESLRETVLAWGEENLRTFPWRGEASPFEVLVAEVLLSRTPAPRVAPVFEELVGRYPSVEAFAEASQEDVAEVLEPLGLHNVRAEAIVRNANDVLDEGVPSDADSLADLHYVGQYAVDATLCFAFGEARPIVDANVVRVYERAFGLTLEPRTSETRDLAERVLPEDDVPQFNLALLDFGAEVCKPRSPECGSCPFQSDCDYFDPNDSEAK